MVEGTCLKEKCYLWRSEGVDCPFYLPTMWRNEDNPTTPQMIEDCAPRRNTILLMEYSNRAIGIQKDYEEQRNMYANVLNAVGKLFEVMQERSKALYKHLNIEYDEEPKLLFTEEEKGQDNDKR